MSIELITTLNIEYNVIQYNMVTYVFIKLIGLII